MHRLSTPAELAGMASISAGCFQLATWLGLIVMGLLFILAGMALGGNDS